MASTKPRLLYITPYEDQVSGVAHKIECQVDALSEQFAVNLVGVIPTDQATFVRPIKRLLNEVRHSLRSIAYQQVYYRYSPACPILNMILAFLSLFRGSRTWIEYNGWYKGELRQSSRLLLYAHFASMAFLKLARVRHLPVTAEIGRLEGLRKFTVLGNGYRRPESNSDKLPDEVSQQIVRARQEGYTLLTFVASKEFPWHGVDLILATVAKIAKACLVLVGEIGAHDEAQDLQTREQLITTGPLPTSALPQIYKAVDFGLGSFAEKRRGLSEAVTLKVREYLANGLPCIIGHHDPLSENEWTKGYLFELTESECSSEKWQEIIERSIDRAPLSHLATQELSWSKTFQRAGVLEEA